ncbi:PREDICTED: uncharacterized protein LOC105573993 isoform X3 [Cercocebus atys]|uniref:uncharacterized protein LOC105573993 isoform X3 n=1 Tax=Cercocebus atys TaxID=9531 RepID=UPI0005F41083|nr:PREDICTED: uncharacterized protein LOC105573993 isoform X3 [Cercocebus atys]
MLCPRPLPGSPVKDRESLAAAASSPSPRLAGAPVTDQVWRFPSVAAAPRGERPLCKRKQVASLPGTASRLLRLGEGKGFQNRGPGRRVSSAASRDCETWTVARGGQEAFTQNGGDVDDSGDAAALEQATGPRGHGGSLCTVSVARGCKKLVAALPEPAAVAKSLTSSPRLECSSTI